MRHTLNGNGAEFLWSEIIHNDLLKEVSALESLQVGKPQQKDTTVNIKHKEHPPHKTPLPRVFLDFQQRAISKYFVEDASATALDT